MRERSDLVTIKGNPVTVMGNEVKMGDEAPDFSVIANDQSDVRLSSFKGKVVVLSAVFSLDTGICDAETRRFNQEAANLSSEVEILTISMDLPFAQKRWCAAAGIDRVQTFSDHRDASFGTSYGILIKEKRMLARAVFVVDKSGIVRHIQLLKDVASEPDYEDVVDAVKKLV